MTATLIRLVELIELITLTTCGAYLTEGSSTC